MANPIKLKLTYKYKTYLINHYLCFEIYIHNVFKFMLIDSKPNPRCLLQESSATSLYRRRVARNTFRSAEELRSRPYPASRCPRSPHSPRSNSLPRIAPISPLKYTNGLISKWLFLYLIFHVTYDISYLNVTTRRIDVFF